MQWLRKTNNAMAKNDKQCNGLKRQTMQWLKKTNNAMAKKG